MASAEDHGKTVLSAVLAARGSMKTGLLDYAVQRLDPEWLTDPVHKVLFTLAQRYADQTGGIITRAALEDLLRGRAPGRALMYGEAYDAIARRPLPSAAEFKHSVSQLRELAAERETGSVLADAMTILRQGLTVGEGRGREELYGHADARAYAMARLSAVDREASGTDSPEGDFRHEGQSVLTAYAKGLEARVNGQSRGVLSGIPALDRMLKGSFLCNGQLGLVAGHTSSGKTAWCISAAWDVAVNQHKNVVYITTETLRTQVRTKLVARHSRLPQFGLPNGLNSRDISEATLDRNGVLALQALLKDFGENQEYGHCYVVQAPRGVSIPVVESRLAAISRQFMPDLVIVDYLQLWKSSRPRKDRREELSEIVTEAKEMAATFADGRGVPVLSPWQVNRTGREAAKSNGGLYTLEALAETAESANTADIVLSLFDQDNDTSKGRSAALDLAVLKNRDGERGGTLRLTADFANAHFGTRERTTSSGDELFALPAGG